jgi:hypothetical protein
VNIHIANHLIVGVGASLLFIAAFFGYGRRAPLRVRLLLLLVGPVGIAWSILGIYLMDHTNAQGHTTLLWAQYAVSHQIQSGRAWSRLFVRPSTQSRVLSTAALWRHQHLTCDEANVPISKRLQRACHDTLDFVSVPGFPSAIRVFALTHSRRIVFQR